MMLTIKKLKTKTNDLCSPVRPVPPRWYQRVLNPSINREHVTLSAIMADTTVSQKAVDKE
jgi:hypothetical protein